MESSAQMRLFFSVIVVFSAACATEDEPDKGLVIQDVCQSGGRPLFMDDVSVAGNDLILDATYGGGCQKHQVTACWDGSVSAEGIATLHLTHDHNDDNCKALVPGTWSFPLEALPGDSYMVVDAEFPTISLLIEE